MSKPTLKYAKVRTSFKTDAYGESFTIPEGSIVSNRTASGFDDNYRFWIPEYDKLKELFPDTYMGFEYDLKYRGVNIPKEYCEPYLIDDIYDFGHPDSIILREYSNGYFMYAYHGYWKVARSLLNLLTDRCLAYAGQDESEAWEALVMAR